jgi:hypothetical protein
MKSVIVICDSCHLSYSLSIELSEPFLFVIHHNSIFPRITKKHEGGFVGLSGRLEKIQVHAVNIDLLLKSFRLQKFLI